MSSAWRIAALDVSYEALRICRRDCSEGVGLVLADARFMPFKDGTFDAVFIFHVAGHLLLKERLKLSAEATRALKSGGGIYFREFEKGDMRFGSGEEVEPGTFRRGEGIITHYFALEEVLELFPKLEPQSVKEKRWSMRIKGRDFQRSEVHAVFKKG